MRDRQDRPVVGRQVLLEPQHALGVQVVGGLVEQQQVGLLSSSLHSATRRRSPPESTLTSASGGGQRSASIACSSWESRSQASAASMASWRLPISSMSSSEYSIGHLLGDLVVPVQLDLDLAEALLDVAEDRLVLVELGLLHAGCRPSSRASGAPRRWRAGRARP